MSHAIEETIAHLTRTIEDLSDEVARQNRALAVLERRVQLLLGRAAEAEAEAQGGAPLADQRPPHW
jgi:SlyX protein